MDRSERRKLANVVRERYQNSGRREKTKILDEFIAITGVHRKHALRMLGQGLVEGVTHTPPLHPRIYDEAVKESLIVLWEASDRICGKRLKAIIPVLLESLESHGRLKLDAMVRARLLKVSPATIDRILRPIRSPLSSPKDHQGNNFNGCVS